MGHKVYMHKDKEKKGKKKRIKRMKKKFFEKNEKEENGTRSINIVYKKILNETKLEEERNNILRE